MKKEYTQNEMEQILRNDAEIPESVERRMKETYEKLGLVETPVSLQIQMGNRTAAAQSAGADPGRGFLLRQQLLS